MSKLRTHSKLWFMHVLRPKEPNVGRFSILGDVYHNQKYICPLNILLTHRWNTMQGTTTTVLCKCDLKQCSQEGTNQQQIWVLELQIGLVESWLCWENELFSMCSPAGLSPFCNMNFWLNSSVQLWAMVDLWKHQSLRLLMWAQILRAGPNLMFIVDIRCSSFSKSKACPSISCDRNWEASSSQPEKKRNISRGT